MTEERFYLYKLFESSPKVSLTHQEIADFYGESIEQIQTWIEEDLDSGMFFTNEDLSNFYLTPIGFDKLYELKRKAIAKTVLPQTPNYRAQ